MKYPYLIILKGKHGDSYFHVGKDGDRESSLAAIFQINFDNGYYPREADQAYHESEIATQNAVIAELQPIIAPLADTIFKRDLIGHLRRAKNLKASHEDSLREILFIKNLPAEDVMGRAKFALDRRDHEYESIDFETYSN